VNGVYVNGHRLTPWEEHQLKDGDIVRVGYEVTTPEPISFVWTYHKSLAVKKRKRKTESPPSENDEKQQLKKSKEDAIIVE
jgi:pSer/pThr/pTyr-binding forkhead associated (FHA) protein